MFRRLYRRSIWHPLAIPRAEMKYRHIKRVWLPLYDVGLIVAAVCGMIFGVPAVEEFYSSVILHIVASFVIVAGFACLAGVSFPALWLLEALAKSAVLGVLLIYAGALIFLTAGGDPNRGFVAVIAVLAMIPPAIRLSILREERLERELKIALALQAQRERRAAEGAAQ